MDGVALIIGGNFKGCRSSGSVMRCRVLRLADIVTLVAVGRNRGSLLRIQDLEIFGDKFLGFDDILLNKKQGSCHTRSRVEMVSVGLRKT